MRYLRLVTSSALVLALACGDDEVAPCEIQQLGITLTGTVDDVENNPVPLSLEEQLQRAAMDPIVFDYLAQVLGHNAPTGSGSTAVFAIDGTPNAAGMMFQLAGSRIDGSVLDILGVMPVVLPIGENPPFSAIPRNGLLLRFVDDDFEATTAEGELTVTQVAPLEGTMHVELFDGAGRARVVDGELVVTRTGPGC
jgi:hypothetical protein